MLEIIIRNFVSNAIKFTPEGGNVVISANADSGNFSNGKEGIEKAFHLAPDLIITDVMMPEMDGFKLCKTIKADVNIDGMFIIRAIEIVEMN